MRLLLAATSLALCNLAPTQVAVTSPAGMMQVAGNAIGLLGPIGAFVPDVYHKITQIDATQPAGARVIQALSFRRSTTGTGGGGTAMVAVRMAHGNFNLITTAGQSVDSLRTSPWVDVFTLKQVTLPAWSPAPQPPAPFDFRLPLDTAFAFDGQQALLFQVVLIDPNNGLGVDAFNNSSVGAPTQAYGQGLGCRIGTREMAVFGGWTAFTDGDALFSATANPGNGLVPGQMVLGIGFTPINQPIPGICAPLLTSGEGYALMNGSFFGTGRLVSISLPSNLPFVGQQFHIQAWAQLSGQPQPFVGSTGLSIGPIPASRTDGFRAALANDPENGTAFPDTVVLTPHRAVVIGIE